MGLFDKLASTENPNVVTMIIGIIIAILGMYSFSLGFPTQLYITLIIVAGIVFSGGFIGLVKTQKLKDNKTEQEIELLKEKIETERHNRIFNREKLLRP